MLNRFSCIQGPTSYKEATAGLARIVSDVPWIVTAIEDLGAPFPSAEPGFALVIEQLDGTRRHRLHVFPGDRDRERYQSLEPGDIIELAVTKSARTYYIEATKIGHRRLPLVRRGLHLKELFLAIEWDPEWADEEYDELVAMIRELVKRQCGSDVRLIRAIGYTIVKEAKKEKEE